MRNVIHGFDKNHFVSGVTFGNLRINGKLITNVEEGILKLESTKKYCF